MLRTHRCHLERPPLAHREASCRELGLHLAAAAWGEASSKAGQWAREPAKLHTSSTGAVRTVAEAVGSTDLAAVAVAGSLGCCCNHLSFA